MLMSLPYFYENWRFTFCTLLLFFVPTQQYQWHVVAQLVEALRYKPEGREFDSRWCHRIFFH